MNEWLEANDENDRVYRYEDLVGQNSATTFADLFHFLRVPLDEKDINELLDAYSFSRLSGRKPGVIDEKSHLRAGGAVTWPNYLSAEHVRSLEAIFDVQKLNELGYEW
jgi:hypothetical protein